ncbi:MAG: protein-L-isoaspartate O-methyltransferase [Tatlockia sp.]|nr:protein-L-isoaspartate O-methyltransferase [Tatlockia sp.]
MIKQQLRTGDVLDERIISLFETISRKEFVPSAYQELAYSDMHIPLGHGQSMLTPLEEGKLLQALQLKGHETVLEIGTGTGFLTALLSHLSKKVLSIDYYQEFTDQARKKLAEHQRDNVELIVGDGSRGWLDKAPYDVMVFSGAIPVITKTHRLQIVPGGKLFAIVGKDPIMQGQLHYLDHDDNWHFELVFETCIPLLIEQSKPKEFVF